MGSKKTWFRIDCEHGVVVARAQGILGMDDVFDGVLGQSLHPDYQPHYDVLWDLADARLLIEVEEIERLSQAISQLPNRAVPHKVAMVAPHDLTRRLTELYPRLGPANPVVYRSFSGVAKALAWLGLPDDFVLWPQSSNPGSRSSRG
jgi:hypothetical protein